MSNKKYRDVFETDNEKSEILIAAYYQAADIRKFEIDMYWKRATYFWALIAVAFAAFFAVSNAEKIASKDFYLVAISSAGLVFTFAWFSVNKGSKYWQENWENHLDLLEDKITGPLYKSKLVRPSEDSFLERYFVGPASYSVSKINQIIALFTMSIWLTFIASIFFDGLGSTVCDVTLYLPTVLAMMFIVLIVICGKSHQKDMNPKFSLRTVNHPDGKESD